MADRPILFSAQMVIALLEGRKTQTRRIIKPQPPADIVRHCWYHAPRYGFTRDHDVTGDWHVVRLLAEPGDRLWVREAWRVEARLNRVAPRDIRTNYPGLKYLATDEQDFFNIEGKGRPGIFMPRWASRLTLIVTDVRIERLQDISEEDARAEGCDVTWSGDMSEGPEKWADENYAVLWNEINGAGAWEANPWVVAYTFTVHLGNIDLIGKDAA